MISRRQWNGFLDRSEPAIVFLIRLCGWSSIIFVFGIFIFIFKEGAPFLWNDVAWEIEGDAIVFSELPFENPEGSLVERINEGVAAGAYPGVERAELRGAHVAVVVEPGAAAETIARAIVDGVPLREDHSHVESFFASTRWYPSNLGAPEFGILALIAGTLSVTIFAMVLCVPLGLGAAVFVSEFCSGKRREILKVVIELLAAIPSVVWGFVGVMVISPILIKVTGRQPGVNMLNGALVLALMSIPIIVSVGEDALKAVPDSFREAALALGASRWQVVYKVLFPAAKNGLLAAVLLGVGRAIGETMAVLMCTGHAAQIPSSILDPVQTLTATIASELGDAVKGDGHYRSLFLIGMVLMAMAFVVNLTADLIVKGVRGKQNA